MASNQSASHAVLCGFKYSIKTNYEILISEWQYIYFTLGFTVYPVIFDRITLPRISNKSKRYNTLHANLSEQNKYLNHSFS